MKAIRLPIGAPMLCMAAAALLAFPGILSAKIEVRAERQSVDCFVGVEELNRIIIRGTDPTELELTVTFGYGTFRFIDREWYWVFTPSQEDIVDSKFVRFQAINKTATDGNPIESDFIISVNKLLWSSEWPYWPLNQDESPVAYAEIPVSLGYKCLGLDGQYHLVLEKDGRYWREVPEPNYDFIPERADVGKKLTYKLFYRSSRKGPAMMIHSNSVIVKDAPFFVTHDSRALSNDYIRFRVWYGTDGVYNTPEGPFLLVKSDGFLQDTAFHIKQYPDGVGNEFEDGDKFFNRVKRDASDTTLPNTDDYLIRVTDKARMIMNRARIKFTVTYPATSQQFESSIVLGGKDK